uniref:GTPase IMAP family member 8 n=1 Tax=Cyprinus carpio carpio TaxID=630221 RepID=A0A9J8CYA7_CYPCA
MSWREGRENLGRSPARNRSQSTDRPLNMARRRSTECLPPNMSDLRIVLLGKSVSENSGVGNFILGRAAFDSEAPPDVVERVGGRLKERHVIIINSPQLLQTNISDHRITQIVRECVNLSDPGPHVIVLILNHEQCSTEDQEFVEKVLHSFSEQVNQHTMVITTQEPTETNDILQKIIQKCANRHFSLQRSSSPHDLLQTFEDIVLMNDGQHLDCGGSQNFVMIQQPTERYSEGVKLNLVLCGSDGTLKSSISERILQQTDRRSDEKIHGHQISLVELPALNQLSEEEVTLCCLSLCHPGVHVFLLIIPDAPINNEDKAEIEEIQRIFSSRINKHIMILIMQNSEHQTAELNGETKSVIESFGGRHNFFGPKTQVSTLMEKIEQMLEENRGELFFTETFWGAQMKKLEEMLKKLHSLQTHIQSQGLTEGQEALRIVILGKTGVGKSATGNTILGREAFLAEASHESITKESQRETSEIDGRHVTVIDTPGLFDTELTAEEIQREITNCISMILPGPHVFINVLSLGQRFTQEEETSVKIIQETFGENSLMYTMVLFTRGDDLKNKTIEQFLGKPGSPLMKLIEACGNRFHVFNNNQTEDRVQVTDLLQKIDNMVKANGGSFYSCKMFRQMEREKQEQQMKILMERVRESEELIDKLEKEKMKIMMEKERQNHDKDRKRREEKDDKTSEREKQIPDEQFQKLRSKEKKICSETDDSIQVTAFRKVENEYSKWSWSLRSAMMETENKLHNNIENEAIHEVKETDLQKELKEASEEVEKSMSNFFEKDTDAEILIQWKTSFEIKIRDVQENIVRETQRKLNEILHQRDLKKKIDVQRTNHENTLYEKSKQLALKLKEKYKAKEEETLKKEFDLFWDQSVKKIIRETPVIKDINIMRDVRKIFSYIYQIAPVGHWRVNKDIFTVPSYSSYVKVNISSGLTGAGYALSTEDEAQIRSLVTDVAHQTDRFIMSFNISKMGYNISCIQQLSGHIRAKVTKHEEGPVKYVFKKKFFMDLVYSIFKRANKKITDQHRLFMEANDPVIYVEKKREEYYSIFQKYCNGATSATIFGEIICQNLKEPIEQSVYKKTARDLTDEIRTNCESLNGSRANLEKHILKTLAEKEDFDKYMNYIHEPRDHFKSFIRDEVSRYITDKFSVSVLPKMKDNIKLLQQKIMKAAHESTEHVQENRGDVGLWLKSFTQRLSDDLIISEKDLSGVKHDDFYDFSSLEDVIRQELHAIMTHISRRFNRRIFPLKLDHKFRPDELLIDHFCQCCWVQCPFCRATCTNTTENHDEDHSVPLHRVNGINGQHFSQTKNLCADICTGLVASHQYFYTSDVGFPYREYRRAGGVYADWSITPDLSELPYWKWFLCRFQKDLEKYYNKTFQDHGKITYEWRKYSKQDAIESLEQYI